MNVSQLAINSVSTIRTELEESLAAYEDAGFRNVEFSLRHVRSHMAEGHKLADVLRLLDRHGLQCIGGFDCAVESFSSWEERARNHQRVLENARFLADLGGRIMVVGTDGPSDPMAVEDPIGVCANTFAEVAGQVAEAGVTLCIEFNWSPLVRSLRTAAEIARLTERDNVGIVFDPAHYHCTPTKYDQLDAANVATVKHVHVDDMRDKPAELSDCNSDRVLPGQGILDLPALFGRLEDLGYSGYYSIELFNEQLWAMPAQDAAKAMYKSLLWLCKVMGE